MYLHHEPIPRNMEGLSYARLFEDSVQHGRVPLGLFRAKGTRGAPLPYTLTNPPPDLSVLAGDEVIMLGFYVPRKGKDSYKVVRSRDSAQLR
eukprot:c16582_g1_i1.p1 GENE.c16582_g1_i1~~c16582_g1_i1.p1  ORF type:complete len:103 (-),score=21.92 c16582_g1_i1:161-436(-)